MNMETDGMYLAQVPEPGKIGLSFQIKMDVIVSITVDGVIWQIHNIVAGLCSKPERSQQKENEKALFHIKLK